MSTTIATTTVTTPVAPSTDSESTGRSNRYKIFGRLVVLIIAAGGITCSVYTLLSCDFFTLTATKTAMNATTTTAGIGIFSFQNPSMEGSTSAKCQAYADGGNFLEPNDWMNSMWTISQYASLVAPLIAASSWLLSLTELLVGKFCGSFLIPVLLFMLACFAQGTTFFMYGQLDVCFKDADADLDQSTVISNSCQLSFGAFLSIAAGFCYYLSSVLLCCLPRPDGCCCKSKDDEGTVPGRGKGTDFSNSSSAADEEDPQCNEISRTNGSVAPSQHRPWQEAY
mmetsp:Transcript_22500/g.36345  ORF Transcript_22500/g.36345 Transcript_22500/m.36345 type:complete len:282 (-) Transcript_22500:357-1202(-)